MFEIPFLQYSQDHNLLLYPQSTITMQRLNIRLFSLFVLLLSGAHLPAQFSLDSLTFLSSTNSTDVYSEVFDIEVDRDGNYYVAGEYRYADIVLGADTLLSHSNPAFRDMFIAKYHPDGTLAWLQKDSGSVSTSIRQVEVDTMGHVYISGAFNQYYNHLAPTHSYLAGLEMDTLPLYQNQLRTGFVAQLDAATGEAIWYRTPLTQQMDFFLHGLHTMAVSPNGDILVSGRMAQSVTFDTTVVYSTTSFPHTDYLGCYDVAGNFQWATAPASIGNVRIEGAGWDTVGNPVISGTFGGEVSFGTDSLINTTTLGLFVVKFHPDGTVNWLTGSTGGGYFNLARGVTMDGDDIYVPCKYSGDFEIQGQVFSAGVDLLGVPGLLKFDGNGDLQWFTGAVSNGGAITADIEMGDVEIADDGIIYAISKVRKGFVFGTDTFDLSGAYQLMATAFLPTGEYISSTTFGDSGGIYAAAGIEIIDGQLGMAGFVDDSIDMGSGMYYAGDRNDGFLAFLGIGNLPPVARDDAAQTPLDAAIFLDVASNDVDPEGLSLVAPVVAVAPAHGYAVPLIGGIVYQPIPGFVGTDTLIYEICDSDPDMECATARVIIQVGGGNKTSTSKTNSEIQLYPNPTQGAVFLEWNHPLEKSGMLVLSAMDGRVLQQKPLQASQGINQTSLDLSNYPAGIYLIQLDFPGSGVRWTHRVVRR